MSGINWKKHADRQRMQRQGVEDRVDASTKDALRREADRLLAGYSGPVTKVPAGIRVTGSQASADRPQMVSSGNVAGSVTENASSMVRGSQSDPRQKRGLRSNPRSKPGRDKTQLSMWGNPQIVRAVPPGLVVYCDGCCEPNPGAGGWGFVVYRDGVEIHAGCGGSDRTTNNVMELTGALMALRWLDEHSKGTTLLRPVTARLFCDSIYVVNGCNDWRHGWKKKGWRRGVEKELANADLWKELDAALIRILIKLEWCKGHAGIIGNERADELSLMGRESILALADPTPMDLIREQLDYSARGGW